MSVARVSAARRGAEIARRLALAGILAVAGMSAGYAQSLIGTWRLETGGLPAFFVFKDCGLLDVKLPGNGFEFTYSVTATGPPLKLEFCPSDTTLSCSSVYAYLLGSETLQLIPDPERPQPSAAVPTALVLQREAGEQAAALCERTSGEPSQGE